MQISNSYVLSHKCMVCICIVIVLPSAWLKVSFEDFWSDRWKWLCNHLNCVVVAWLWLWLWLQWWWWEKWTIWGWSGWRTFANHPQSAHFCKKWSLWVLFEIGNLWHHWSNQWWSSSRECCDSKAFGHRTHEALETHLALCDMKWCNWHHHFTQSWWHMHTFDDTFDSLPQTLFCWMWNAFCDAFYGADVPLSLPKQTQQCLLQPYSFLCTLSTMTEPQLTKDQFVMIRLCVVSHIPQKALMTTQTKWMCHQQPVVVLQCVWFWKNCCTENEVDNLFCVKMHSRGNYETYH